MKQLLLTIAAILFVSTSHATLKIRITNPTSQNRQSETVALPLSKIVRKLPKNTTPEQITVRDENSVPIPTQITTQGELLFQVTISARTTLSYTIDRERSPEQHPVKTFGRLVPERKDDWAWENNKIAFRVYGPALQATGEVSNGIDVWVKRTEELVIDNWYKPGVDYHTDHGQGLDYYKVGRTLGAGAMAPTNGRELYLSNNFTKAELIETGPVRTTFRLSYAPYQVKGVWVTQQRTISLDANSHFNRIVERFTGDFDTLEVAAGIILRKSPTGEYLGQSTTIDNTGAIYAEEEDPKNGRTYLSVVVPSGQKVGIISNHLTVITKAANDQPLTYYNGAGWSCGGITSPEAWEELTAQHLHQINNPLIIEGF